MFPQVVVKMQILYMKELAVVLSAYLCGVGGSQKLHLMALYAALLKPIPSEPVPAFYRSGMFLGLCLLAFDPEAGYLPGGITLRIRQRLLVTLVRVIA